MTQRTRKNVAELIALTMTEKGKEGEEHTGEVNQTHKSITAVYLMWGGP